MKSVMNSVWMSGVWLPSHTMRVVSATLGSGVSVLPVTTPELLAPPPSAPPAGGGTSLALTMMVRGPSTTMPASDGSPSDTRLMGFFSWSTRLLPLRTQIASPGSSMAPPRLGAAAASAGMVSFWKPSEMVLVAPRTARRLVHFLCYGRVPVHAARRENDYRGRNRADGATRTPTPHKLLPSSPGAGSSHRTGSEQRLPGHLLSQEDLHRVACRPLRMADLGHSRGRTAIPLEQDPADDARRLDDLLISIVSRCEADRLEARGERQPLGVLGGDQQRDRRHLDRLLVLLLDALAGAEHLHVLQDHLALLVLLALGLAGDHHVDVAVRRDEAAYAGHRVDPDRHAAHPLGHHERQETGALRDQGLLEDRLVPLDGGASDTAEHVLRGTRGALGLGLDRPRDQLHLIGLDARADRDLVAGNHHVDRRTMPRVADLGDLLLQVVYVPDAHRSRQRPHQNRDQKNVTGLHSPTTLPSSGVSSARCYRTLPHGTSRPQAHPEGERCERA